MAFYGCSFTYDSTPCGDYGLMLYDFGNNTQGECNFASVVNVEEEIVGNRWRPYFYGVTFGNKLEITLVFGVNVERIEESDISRPSFLSRSEINEIATWLTGHEEYKWLTIDQPDMAGYRYRCVCTGLSLVSYGNIPWAFQATFTCDSPYAYTQERVYEYSVSGTETVQFDNASSINGYYMPSMEIVQDGGTFSIINESDNSREFKLTEYPASVQHVYVDNDHEVLTCDQDINLYPYFNYQFVRLKRGLNTLRITGNGNLIIRCVFPVNVGS